MNLFEKFSIEPNNEDYYNMAFTHGSYATVNGIKYDYERLEFLGDSILNMLVSEYLYKKYPKYGEGKLTKLRANYVCQAQADVSRFYRAQEYPTGNRAGSNHSKNHS